MIFLTSLVFSVLFLLIEPALMALAQAIPAVPYSLALAGLNLLVYVVIFFLVRVSRMVFEDSGMGETRVQGVRVRDWLEVNRCRWLNLLGLVGITVGAGLVFSTGRLPLPFWFLYAAIILGLLDVFKRDRLVPLKSNLPVPRFDVIAAEQLSEQAGRKLEFTWRPWPDGGNVLQEFTASFVIDDKAYQKTRKLPRLPTDKLENYLRYVRDEFTESVQQVAAHIRRQSEEKEFTLLQEVGNAVCFTRSIPYARDEDTHNVPDYANYPIETLYETAGDCEDHAILAACLLYYLGHDVGLFFLKFSDSGHIALGYNTKDGAGPFSARASNGTEYYYIETVPTSASEQIGDISEEFLKQIKQCTAIGVE
jgi:predicted transglutaminase-like cysteine proteinase